MPQVLDRVLNTSSLILIALRESCVPNVVYIINIIRVRQSLRWIWFHEFILHFIAPAWRYWWVLMIVQGVRHISGDGVISHTDWGYILLKLLVYQTKCNIIWKKKNLLVPVLGWPSIILSSVLNLSAKIPSPLDLISSSSNEQLQQNDKCLFSVLPWW